MKKRIYIVLVMFAALAITFNGCKQSELEDLYPDPAKTSIATVPQYFTGILEASREVVLPWYWRFFVVEQPTMGIYTQMMGLPTQPNQYVPGASPVDWRWDRYYNGIMTNYRVFQSLFDELTEEEQAEMRIFDIAATIFFYDQTQQMIDIFGDIPWSEAGMVRELGDLDAALPKYDTGEEIYTAMIADLKALATELSSFEIDSYTAGVFAEKDLLNNGVVSLWEKYANSLRLRMLMRASDAMDVTTEVAEILYNPGTWPVVEGNEENIMMVGESGLQSTTSSGTGGIRSAMETWGQYDLAPKAVCDFMVNNADPRLEITFDPGIAAGGEYTGVDPLMDATQQNQFISDGFAARYDTATFTRNNQFPGWVIGASEVYFMKAEAALFAGLDAEAKAAYEAGVMLSIEHYYQINARGTEREPIAAPTMDAILAYLNAPEVSWDANTDKINLIATQKWLDTGLGSLTQTWSEMRRLDLPVLTYWEDNASASGQTLPPMRFSYPASESALNGDNYSAVSGEDNLKAKIFWDVN